MDNRGHRLVAPDDSAMNVPAIGAAHVVKRHAPQAPDKLQLEVRNAINSIVKVILNTTTIIGLMRYKVLVCGVRL